MKFKTTQKDIKSNYLNVYQVYYCDLQYLLSYVSPIAYTCGVYGWNADIYEISHDIAIVTGYRPFGKTIKHYEIIRNYEHAAKGIVNSSLLTYEQKKAQLETMIKQLAIEL